MIDENRAKLVAMLEKALEDAVRGELRGYACILDRGEIQTWHATGVFDTKNLMLNLNSIAEAMDLHMDAKEGKKARTHG